MKMFLNYCQLNIENLQYLNQFTIVLMSTGSPLTFQSKPLKL